MPDMDSLTPSSRDIGRRRRSGQRMSATERQQTQDAFLQAFASHANVSRSCLEAKVSRSQVYEWMKDEGFKARYEVALLEARDALEYAAYTQAVDGTEEYVVSAGKVMYGADGRPLMNRRYSPQLLITLLKATLPEKYKEKQQVEHSGSIDIAGSQQSLLAKLQSMAQEDRSE